MANSLEMISRCFVGQGGGMPLHCAHLQREYILWAVDYPDRTCVPAITIKVDQDEIYVWRRDVARHQ